MGGDRRVSEWGSGAGGYVYVVVRFSPFVASHPRVHQYRPTNKTNQNRASSTEATTEQAYGNDDGSHDDAAAAATTLKDKMAALDAARARVHAVQDAGAARRAEVGCGMGDGACVLCL